LSPFDRPPKKKAPQIPGATGVLEAPLLHVFGWSNYSPVLSWMQGKTEIFTEFLHQFSENRQHFHSVFRAAGPGG
ncbi:hypothetical protein, partial [Faecalibaculum rodentium]|uniref:hypothetical protein n=1 Tax=Faecalibaculum rodentium TaxID=1702221 RepID=UPI00256F29A6